MGRGRVEKFAVEEITNCFTHCFRENSSKDADENGEKIDDENGENTADENGKKADDEAIEEIERDEK